MPGISFPAGPGKWVQNFSARAEVKAVDGAGVHVEAENIGVAEALKISADRQNDNEGECFARQFASGAKLNETKIIRGEDQSCKPAGGL